MELLEINNAEGFLELENVWNPLLRQSGSDNIHSTFEWLSLWWKHFGRDKELFILAVKDEGEIIGVAPLMMSRINRIKSLVSQRVIKFIGQGPSDYADFIIIDKRRQVLEAILDYLIAESYRWDRLDLHELPGDSPNISILTEIVSRRNFRHDKRISTLCPYIPIKTEWAEYYSHLGSKFKSDLRRKSNRGNEIGTVKFIRQNDSNNVSELLEKIFEVNRKHVEVKNKQDLLRSKSKHDFIKETATWFGRIGLLDISALTIDDTVIAYNLGFSYNGIAYHWNVGFDPQYSSLSPGKLLIKFLLEDCFNRGYNEFDFMRGGETYKLNWTNKVRINYSLTIYNNALRAQIMFFLLKLASLKSKFVR